MKTTKTTNNMMNEDLSALVAKAKTGDQAAFTELYDRTAPELYRCIRAMTRDEDLTWDIQQDAYLKAYESLNTLESNDAFFPWLRRIAVNGTVSHMRKQRTLSFTELVSDEDADTTPELPDLSVENQPELSLDRKETARLVQEILSKLPEEQQLIVGMHYYDELSVKEIAETLKLSTGAVKAQLFHGRKKVETAVRALEKQGVKLYGLSPVAFLVALMRRAEPAASASVKQAAVKAAVARASVDAVASAAVPVAAKTFGQVLAGRLLAGALAVALIGGGIWGGAKLLKSGNTDAPYQPTTSVTDERLAGVETPEELTATNEDLPVVTEPVVTNPISTEPEESEAPTEPTKPSEPKPSDSTEPTNPGESVDPSESGEAIEPSESGEQPERLAHHCGENLTWSYDPKWGTLTIQGSGPMYDYDNASDRAPWYEYHDAIRDINFPAGLTTIGSYAFCDCTAFGSYDGLSFLPNGLSTIGRGAFTGCSNINRIILPESLSSVADSAFSGCTNLREIWVLNPSCRIDANQGFLSNVMVCAYPGSSAEQLVQANGCASNPIVVDQSMVVARMKQSLNAMSAGWFVKIGTRYLVEVKGNEPLVVTEAELQQAKENGSIVLKDREYRYTESIEEVNNYIEEAQANYMYLNSSIEGDAWLLGPDVLTAVRTENGYVFYRNRCDGATVDYLSDRSTNVGWIWLDADTIVSDMGEERTFAEFAAQTSYGDNPSTICPNFYLILGLNDDIRLIKTSAGRK